MADRVLKVLPGDRYVVQGISNAGGSRFSAVQANSEEFTYKIDFERWLDGATIASNTVTPSGATVGVVASSTYLTLTVSAVSGSGQVEITVVATDGRAKDLIIALIQGRANVVPAYIVSPESEASKEGYNNTDSNLAATNVQEAIDELAVDLTGTSVKTSEIVFTFDGGGAAIPGGTQRELSVPFACSITSWVLLSDQAATAVLDVWMDTYSNYPPTIADTIVGGAYPALSAASKNETFTLTGWTTAIAAGDTLKVNVNSNDLAQRLTLGLTITKS